MIALLVRLRCRVFGCPVPTLEQTVTVTEQALGQARQTSETLRASVRERRAQVDATVAEQRALRQQIHTGDLRRRREDIAGTLRGRPRP